MGKSSPSVPAPPDPFATADAQAAANIDAARATARLNRYNVNTPYGTQTWDNAYSPQDRAQLDRYDRAMDRYRTDLSAYRQAAAAGGGGTGQPRYDSSGNPLVWRNGQAYDTAGTPVQGMAAGGGGAQAGMPQAPERPDVYPSQWTQTIALSPAGRQNLDLQNRLTNQALTFGNAQLGRVAGNVGQPLGFPGAPAQVAGVGQTIGGGQQIGGGQAFGGGSPGQQPEQQTGPQLIATTGNSHLYAPQPGRGAQARFQALGAQLQADPTLDAAQAQRQFFDGLAPGEIGGIIRDNPGLQGMALGNAGARLATLYGPGRGDAVARWSDGVQGLMGQGMDVASAHNQVLGGMDGGDLAAILQDPAAASYGAAARGAIAQRADQLAAARDRPDQGAGQVQRSLQTENLPAMPSLIPQADPYQMDLQRQRVEDALYARTAARLDPQWQERQQALEARLAVQGIPIGSEAYNDEMDRFARARNDAYSGAMNDAILAGGGEQSRLFGLGMAGRQQGFNEALAGGQFANAAQNQAYGQAANTRSQLFGERMQTGQQDFYQQLQNAQLRNQARQQAIQEQLMLRNQPINELVALLGTSGGVQMPQFGAPAQVGVQPADVQGAVYGSYNGRMNAYNAQQQANAAGMQGLGSLLGAAAGAMPWSSWLGPTAAAGASLGISDRRLKRDIALLDRLPNGLGVYAFRYLWRPERFVGLMADEVRRVAPWAVFKVGDFDAVDYGAIGTRRSGFAAG